MLAHNYVEFHRCNKRVRYYANVGRSVRENSAFHLVIHTHRSMHETKCGVQGLTQHVLFCRRSTNFIHGSKGLQRMRT